MTYTTLIVRNFRRNRLRTALTGASIMLAVFLVCAVLTLPSGLAAIVDRMASATRLSVHNKAGIAYLLPYSYLHKIRAVPGVAAATSFMWFGGIYDEPKNMFPNFAIDPDTVAAMWPDYQIDPEALARFRTMRNAALVGETTFKKFNWRVGQEVTLRGTIFPVDLTFRIVGVIRTAVGNPMVFWFNRKYLEEAMEGRGGFGVGMIWLRAERADQVDAIMQSVDDLFRNSEAEVASETEKSFIASFFSSFQGIIRVVLMVGFLVVGAVVLIAANTAAMGVRERIPEIAILKSLGFGRRPILLALLAESGTVALIGGLAGAGAAWTLFSALRNAGKTGYSQLLGPLGQFQMSGAVFAEGVTVALVVGLIAGFVPAWNGARLGVVEALRRLF